MMDTPIPPTTPPRPDDATDDDDDPCVVMVATDGVVIGFGLIQVLFISWKCEKKKLFDLKQIIFVSFVRSFALFKLNYSDIIYS